MTDQDPPLVGILMGSRNDWDVMKAASETLSELAIAHECKVLSAHRTPKELAQYVTGAEGRGIRVLIAGAGGAAHLAGSVAASTVLPVLGVPLASSDLNGLDALLSTAQMPRGVPVGTLAIGAAGAINAALLAASIIGVHDEAVRDKIREGRAAMARAVLESRLD